MKIVLPPLTSITNRVARDSFFSSPPAPEDLASTSLLQTSLYYMTRTGKFLSSHRSFSISNQAYTGIHKQTFKLWIEHTVSVKRNRCMCSDSSLRKAWRNECSSVARKSCAWISWSFNKVDSSYKKVRGCVKSLALLSNLRWARKLQIRTNFWK